MPEALAIEESTCSGRTTPELDFKEPKKDCSLPVYLDNKSKTTNIDQQSNEEDCILSESKSKNQEVTSSEEARIGMRDCLHRLFLEDMPAQTVTQPTMTTNDDHHNNDGTTTSEALSKWTIDSTTEEEENKEKKTTNSTYPELHPTAVSATLNFLHTVNHLDEETIKETESFWYLTRTGSGRSRTLSKRKAAMMDLLFPGRGRKSEVEEEKEEDQQQCHESSSTTTKAERRNSGSSGNSATTALMILGKITSNLGEETVDEDHDFWALRRQQQCSVYGASNSRVFGDMFSDLHDECPPLKEKKEIEPRIDLAATLFV